MALNRKFCLECITEVAKTDYGGLHAKSPYYVKNRVEFFNMMWDSGHGCDCPFDEHGKKLNIKKTIVTEQFPPEHCPYILEHLVST
jgi:hypothetical protein